MSPQSESGLPDEVARATETSEPGDAADQADRLTMIMEAEVKQTWWDKIKSRTLTFLRKSRTKGVDIRV